MAGQTKSFLDLMGQFLTQGQKFMENRHLLSEPEASEPVADSPLEILLCGLSASNPAFNGTQAERLGGRK